MNTTLLACFTFYASLAQGQTLPAQPLAPKTDLTLEGAFQEAAQTMSQDKTLPSVDQPADKAPPRKKFPKVGKKDPVLYQAVLPCHVPVAPPVALAAADNYLKPRQHVFHTADNTQVRISANKDFRETDKRKGWFLLLYIESKNLIAWAKADPDAHALEPFRINTPNSSEFLVLNDKRYFLDAGVSTIGKIGILFGKNEYRTEFKIVREGDPNFKFTSTVGELGIDMQNTGPAFQMLGKTYHAVYAPAVYYDRSLNQLITTPNSHNLILNVYNTKTDQNTTWYEEDFDARIRLKNMESIAAPRKASYLKKVGERSEGDRKFSVIYSFHINEKRELEICDVTSLANSK